PELTTVAAQLRWLVEAAHASGRIPESAHEAGQARLDVQAQVVRAGILLSDVEVKGAPARATLEAIADSLARRVTAGGGLPFSPATATTELNVWTAMFAEQALAFVDLPSGT